jgi:hypothetical protein
MLNFMGFSNQGKPILHKRSVHTVSHPLAAEIILATNQKLARMRC